MPAESATQSPMLKLYDAIRQGLRIAAVAKVEAYDASKPSCDVVVLVQEERMVNNARRVIPEIRVPGVPVMWPGGSTRSLTMGLEVGDLVLLLVRHRSHDEIDGGEPGPVQPVSTRRMNYADAVALPGFVPPDTGMDSGAFRADGQPVLAMPPGEAAHVGASTANLVLVREDLLSSFLSTLKAWIDGHTHTGVTTGPGVSGIPVVPLSPSAGAISSDRIKVDS